MNERTIRNEAFRNCAYGLFFHFLNRGPDPCNPGSFSQKTPLPPDEWNRLVDSFDVDGIARQVHEAGATMAWLTIGQQSGSYCCPNAAYDRITGRTGSKSLCSKRDLISDFADALAKYDILLGVYSTCLLPFYSDHTLFHDEYTRYPSCPSRKMDPENLPRLKDFLSLWTEIHREWSMRWGRKVTAWWLDGMYCPEMIYQFPDAPNGQTFADALRSGNPDALVAFNPGVVYPPQPNYPSAPEDFTAGESDDPDLDVVNGTDIQGLQYHVLAFTGSGWGIGPLKDRAILTRQTRNITDNGGIINWDVPFLPSGISEENMKTLRAFGKAYQDSFRALPKTPLHIKPPVVHEDGKVEDGEAFFPDSCADGAVLRWNEMEIPVKKDRIPLPIFGRKRQYISLERNGYCKGFPVFPAWRLNLNGTCTRTFHLETEDRVKIADYQFSVTEHVLKIHAVIREDVPTVNHDAPWSNSCLELFIARADQMKRRQFCIMHDGTVREYNAFYGLQATPRVRLETTRSEKELVMDVSLDLPEEYRNSFRLEIQQTVNRAGKPSSGVLFGPNVCAIGSYAAITY